SYAFPKQIATPVTELIGLSDQQPTKGIMTIEQMAGFVETHESDRLLNQCVHQFNEHQRNSKKN
ncbi:hypothetical protein, partial [Desulfosarcina sp.]|uniref:hypothetical protein n=1 Tax=Desulfosarcina sp. TaxID=2027861 RepID=UPI0029A50CBC